jgi:hypothetical protein
MRTMLQRNTFPTPPPPTTTILYSLIDVLDIGEVPVPFWRMCGLTE